MSEKNRDEYKIKIKKILAAIDGSEKADKALDHALWLAGKIDAEVEIFNSVAPVNVPAASPAAPGVTGTAYLPGWANTYYEEFREQNKEMLEARFTRSKERFPDLTISKKIVEGKPKLEIIREAEQNDFDLIVMGSRGLGELEEIVLGSVSDAVVNRSKVPVFIVK